MKCYKTLLCAMIISTLSIATCNAMTPDEFKNLNAKYGATVRTEKTVDEYGRAIEGLRGIHAIQNCNAQGKAYFMGEKFIPKISYFNLIGTGIPVKLTIAFEKDNGSMEKIDCPLESYSTDRYAHNGLYIIPEIPPDGKVVGVLISCAGYTDKPAIDPRRAKDMERMNNYINFVREVRNLIWK